MLKYGNKEFRNLQEQVEENARDIDDILTNNLALSTYGLKVVEEFPTRISFNRWEMEHVHDHEYGDAVIIGTQEPYDMLVWTRGGTTIPEDHWFELGQFPMPGPTGQEGAVGPAGPKGDTGASTTWRTGSVDRIIGGSLGNPGDLYLVSTGNQTGDVFVKNEQGTGYGRLMSIMGPQGPQGLTGPQGETGPQGIQGPKGDTGDVGGFINIRGVLTSSSLLPDPETLNDPTAAYLVGDNKDLYIQVGETKEDRQWLNVGMLNMGTYVEVEGNFQNVWSPDNLATKAELENKVTTDTAQTISGIKTFATDNLEDTPIRINYDSDECNGINIFDINPDTDTVREALYIETDHLHRQRGVRYQNIYFPDFSEETGVLKLATRKWVTDNLPEVPDVEIDEKTIIRDDDGKLKTAIGGYIEGKATEKLINATGSSALVWNAGKNRYNWPSGYTYQVLVANRLAQGLEPLAADNRAAYDDLELNKNYPVTVNGEECTIVFESREDTYTQTPPYVTMNGHLIRSNGESIGCGCDYGTSNVWANFKVYGRFDEQPSITVEFTAGAGEVAHPIDGRVIPVDGDTIVLDDGKLKANIPDPDLEIHISGSTVIEADRPKVGKSGSFVTHNGDIWTCMGYSSDWNEYYYFNPLRGFNNSGYGPLGIDAIVIKGEDEGWRAEGPRGVGAVGQEVQANVGEPSAELKTLVIGYTTYSIPKKLYEHNIIVSGIHKVNSDVFEAYITVISSTEAAIDSLDGLETLSGLTSTTKKMCSGRAPDAHIIICYNKSYGKVGFVTEESLVLTDDNYTITVADSVREF